MGSMTDEEIRDMVMKATEELRAEDKLNVNWKDVKNRKTAQKASSSTPVQL